MVDARGLLRAVKWDGRHFAADLRRHISYSPRWRNIVFVVGCGRSGTTLLGTLLAAHPDVHYLNEPRDRWTALASATDDIDLFGPGRNKLCFSAEDTTPEQATSFRRLFGVCDSGARRALVEKLPQNCFRIRWLQRLAPGAKFVHIVRNWPAVVASITKLSLDTTYTIAGRAPLNRWWGTRHSKLDRFAEELEGSGLLPIGAGELPSVPASAADYAKLAACEWYASVRAVQRTKASLAPDYIEIRYEDLVREPASNLTRIFEFVGLVPDPHVLEKATRLVRSTASQAPVLPGVDGAILDACNDLAKDLGYDRTPNSQPAYAARGGVVRDRRQARVAILFERFGPYHHARVRAAATRLSVHAIEIFRRDVTYAWDALPEHDEYPRDTLFPDSQFKAARHGQLRNTLWQALDKAAPSVVAIPGWAYWYSHAALAWAIRNDARVIVMSETTRADRTRAAPREVTKRAILAGCDSALVGGTPQWRYLVELGFPAHRIELGYDAIDNDYFIRESDLARQSEELIREEFALPPNYFLASCRFIRRKNVDGLLRAYAMYRQREGAQAFGLVLLGDGPERDSLIGLAATLGVAKFVQFMGFRQYPELPRFYALAAAFILPSLREPWGLVVNEAMASRLPVLVSETAGCARDLVVPGKTGWRFPPDQPSVLADLLSAVAARPGDAARIGAEARSRIQAWGPARFAEGLARACDTALGQPRARLSSGGRLVLEALAYR
jgi:1,2-diacylglycerol 3-alpha-glucosyltransferase